MSLSTEGFALGAKWIRPCDADAQFRLASPYLLAIIILDRPSCSPCGLCPALLSKTGSSRAGASYLYALLVVAPFFYCLLSPPFLFPANSIFIAGQPLLGRQLPSFATMRFFTSLAALSLAFSSTFAAPVEQNEHTLETRQSGIVLTTGAQGNILVRKEIRQLKDQNLDQWTLFILAMKSWYTQSQSSSTSFFGMANIHGVPMGNYNGVGQCSNCNGATGYGVHDSILFPPWHRVYLAHFEQELIKVAKNVANSYPASGNNGWTRSRMVTAANNLRLPYWDWAAKVPSGRPAMPLMFTDTTVTVWDATGQKTYENPLYTFRINDPSGMLYTPFANWRQTYRWPNNNSNNPSSQTGKMASAFANARQGYADQVYSLFTQCDDYLHWSNDQAGSSSTRCSTSIEAVHNNVHNIVGGPPGSVSGGHMTYLPLGAMDPTFFLHRTNLAYILSLSISLLTFDPRCQRRSLLRHVAANSS